MAFSIVRRGDPLKFSFEGEHVIHTVTVAELARIAAGDGDQPDPIQDLDQRVARDTRHLSERCDTIERSMIATANKANDRLEEIAKRCGELEVFCDNLDARAEKLWDCLRMAMRAAAELGIKP